MKILLHYNHRNLGDAVLLCGILSADMKHSYASRNSK